MITRADFSTPDKKNKADSALSTGLGEEQSSYLTTQSLESTNLGHQGPIIAPFEFHNFRSSQRKVSMRIKQEEKLKKRRILKQVLSKMMVMNYFNTKTIFNRIRELPERQVDKMANIETALERVAKELIFNTPISPETAFLRSIIKLRNSRAKNISQKSVNKIQVDRKNSLANLNHSLTIYPCQRIQLQGIEKEAFKYLQTLVKDKIKRIIRCFRRNLFTSAYVKNYIRKCIVNVKENQLFFIRKLRVMTKIHRQSVMNVKRKGLQSLLTKCLQRRDKIIVENLKSYYQESRLKKLVSLQVMSRCQKYQKLSAFFAIYRESIKNSKEKGRSVPQSVQGPENSSIRNLRLHIEALRKNRG